MSFQNYADTLPEGHAGHTFPDDRFDEVKTGFRDVVEELARTNNSPLDNEPDPDEVSWEKGLRRWKKIMQGTPKEPATEVIWLTIQMRLVRAAPEGRPPVFKIKEAGENGESLVKRWLDKAKSLSPADFLYHKIGESGAWKHYRSIDIYLEGTKAQAEVYWIFMILPTWIPPPPPPSEYNGWKFAPERLENLKSCLLRFIRSHDVLTISDEPVYARDIIMHQTMFAKHERTNAGDFTVIFSGRLKNSAVFPPSRIELRDGGRHEYVRKSLENKIAKIGVNDVWPQRQLENWKLRTDVALDACCFVWDFDIYEK